MFIIAIAVFLIMAVAGFFKYNPAEKISENPSPAESMKELKKLRLVYMKDVGDTAFLIDFAQDKDFFKKNNLNVELNPVTNKAANILAAGEADVTITGLTGPLTMYLNGAELRWLASSFRNFSYFGVSRFSKENTSQIKKVAINEFGKEPHFAMVAALKNLGVDPANVEFLAIPFVSQGPMLDKGEIDFVLLPSEKFLIDAKAEEKHYVFEPSDILKDFNSPRSIITTKKAINSSSEELKLFVSAVGEALKYIPEHPDEVKDYIRQKYGFSAERTQKTYDLFVQSEKDIDFVPQKEYISGIVDLVVKEAKPGDPNRDIDGFIYADFAKEAAGKK